MGGRVSASPACGDGARAALGAPRPWPPLPRGGWPVLSEAHPERGSPAWRSRVPAPAFPSPVGVLAGAVVSAAASVQMTRPRGRGSRRRRSGGVAPPRASARCPTVTSRPACRVPARRPPPPVRPAPPVARAAICRATSAPSPPPRLHPTSGGAHLSPSPARGCRHPGSGVRHLSLELLEGCHGWFSCPFNSSHTSLSEA